MSGIVCFIFSLAVAKAYSRYSAEVVGVCLLNISNGCATIYCNTVFKSIGLYIAIAGEIPPYTEKGPQRKRVEVFSWQYSWQPSCHGR